MGLIDKLKTGIHGKNVRGKPPMVEHVVRNPKSKKRTLHSHTHRRSALLENTSPSAAHSRNPNPNSSERRRMHMDRLYNIGSQFVKESLRERSKFSSVPRDKRKLISYPPKKTYMTLPKAPATKPQKNEEAKDEEIGIMNPTQISCNLVDMLSSLYLCGCDRAPDEVSEQPLANEKVPKEETKEKEPSEVVRKDQVRSIPCEISFSTRSTKRDDISWAENHILLSEVDEGSLSLAPSLLSRLRRNQRAREAQLPKMRVYVEQPKRVSSMRSSDFSVLTEPGR